MNLQTNYYTNWSKNIFIKANIYYPKNIIELKKLIKKKNFIIIGNQRSFGDTSFNKKNLISLKNFNKIKKFNIKKGLIDIEAGKKLANILKIIVPNGWFIPVTPGTKYVTVGGMIANNVHGKNRKRNSIRDYIKEITILNENNKIIVCSDKKNIHQFNAIIGGFGLTGVILSAKIKLKRISSSFIDQKIIEFNNYKDLIRSFIKNKTFEYSVAWVEKFSKESISGLLYLANHSKQKNLPKNIIFHDRKMSFLEYLFLRVFSQNYFLIKILNLSFKKFKFYFYKKCISFNEFFYPQDKYLDFNRIYKKGFFQTQFLIEVNQINSVFDEIQNFFTKKKIFSTFTILKYVNEKGRNLDFAGNGISISMDIPIDKDYKNITTFFNNLFIKYKIRINFSKDIILDKNIMRKNKNFMVFKKLIKTFNKKNKMQSLFSKRLGLT